MVSRISTLGQTNRALSFTRDTTVRINELITQISSGKKAQQYEGLARSTNELINTENQILRNDEFMDSIDIAQRRLDGMEDSMDSVFDLVTDFRQTLVSARNADNYNDLPLNTMAEDLYEQVAQFLNVEQDNRFLFSGTRTNVQPVVDFERFQQNLQNTLTPNGVGSAVSTFTKPGSTAAEATAFLDISALAPPDEIDNTPQGLGTGMPVRTQQIMDFLGFDNTDANRQADGTLFGSLTNPNNLSPNTGVAVSFGNDPTANEIGGLDFKSLYYQGDTNQLSARIEEDATINYGITADQRGFEQVLTAAAILALPEDFDFNQAGAGSGNGTIEIEDRIDVALRLLEQAQKDALEPSNGGPNLTNIRTFVGSDIKRLDETEKRLTNFEVFFEETVAEIENTDITEAATLLSQNQLILESSFLSIAQINQTSLLNFLR